MGGVDFDCRTGRIVSDIQPMLISIETWFIHSDNKGMEESRKPTCT